MVEIITKINRHLYRDELEEMFQQRYRVFIQGLGWTVPGSEHGRDEDAFDTEATIYLIERHPKTRMLTASCRLNPTIKPHLMSEIFPHQCELTGVPQAPDIWELSRVLYDGSRIQGTLFKKTRSAMKLAITEFCATAGIQSLTWLSRRVIFANMQTFWPTRPLGGSQFYEDDQEHYVAAISDINEKALKNARAKYAQYSDEPLALTSQIPASAWNETLISTIDTGSLV